MTLQTKASGMVQMSSKHAKLTLRLDNGSLIGPSTKLGGDSEAGTVLLPTDKAFSRGLLTVDQARRLELLLREMHSRAPAAAPLRSLPAAGHKHAHESVQVVFLLQKVSERMFCAEVFPQLSMTLCQGIHVSC